MFVFMTKLVLFIMKWVCEGDIFLKTKCIYFKKNCLNKIILQFNFNK